MRPRTASAATLTPEEGLHEADHRAAPAPKARRKQRKQAAMTAPGKLTAARPAANEHNDIIRKSEEHAIKCNAAPAVANALP